MILPESSQNVLALAYYGVQIYPPTDSIEQDFRDKRNGKLAGRCSAIKCCQSWGLIDDSHQITARGLEVLRLGGRL